MDFKSNQCFDYESDYEIDELLPILTSLVNKYTGFESTSVTYEKANQLMNAILYTLSETAGSDYELLNKRSANEAYQLGYNLLKEKVAHTLSLYNDMLLIFDSYNNRSLNDTVVKGMPEFFKWYDVKFNPQDTILTLDYPLYIDLSHYQGIDKIEKYLTCIRTEQIFLNEFPRDFIVETLFEYDADYTQMIDNLVEIVFTSVIYHFILQMPLNIITLTKDDIIKLIDISNSLGRKKLKERLIQLTDDFVKNKYNSNPAVYDYLIFSLDNILTRLFLLAK